MVSTVSATCRVCWYLGINGLAIYCLPSPRIQHRHLPEWQVRAPSGAQGGTPTPNVTQQQKEDNDIRARPLPLNFYQARGFPPC